MRDDKILVTGSGDGSIAFVSADSGQILALLLNVIGDNDFLIACPPDKVFPTGFFYTTNKDFIQVVIRDEEKRIQEILNLNDSRREAYISKLNLKNLVITRLKNKRHYTSLTEQYLLNQKMRTQLGDQKMPLLLKV
jgi:hypothetical protein